MTTKLMKTLIQKASTLPPQLQDQIAEQWLAELADDQRWNEAFSKSGEVLDTLAQQALRDHRRDSAIPRR